MQAIHLSVKCRTKLNGMLMACIEAVTDCQHFLAALGEHGTRLELALLALVPQSCLTLCNPMDCSPPGSSVHGILQARILEWAAIPFSRGSSRPMNPSLLHCRRILSHLSHQGSWPPWPFSCTSKFKSECPLTQHQHLHGCISHQQVP